MSQSESVVACFDTNVFDHLEQRSNGVTEWDLYRLRRAVKHGCVRLVLSFLNIEETLFLVRSQPKRADARVKLILELGDKGLFAVGQEVIMNNDICAYARGTPRIAPFISMDPWTELNIRNLIQPTGSYLEELHDLVEENRQDKIRFQNFLDEGKAKMKPMADSIGAKRYPFERYWNNNSGWLVEGLADHAGVLSAVKQRGVAGLLKIKSVALAVGANLSLLYSHQFGNRAPESGDSRDMLHAIVASIADVFVTNDKALGAVLSHIPVDSFKVMNLAAFLESLPKWV